MAKCGYTVITGGKVSLSAATAKSVLGVKAHANSGIDLLYCAVALDASGSTAPTLEPVLIEVCYCTFATQSPGTASTSVTPLQKYGRVLTAGFTAGKTWTTEPTTITVLDEFTVHPQSGFKEWTPLGTTADTALGEGIVIRVTSANALDVRATMLVERI